ncbi:MAG: energy transducer TonB, partial [Acidobacteria bacterium]|nr:energy transducer TonB [Acidobacteriota bacterium]
PTPAPQTAAAAPVTPAPAPATPAPAPVPVPVPQPVAQTPAPQPAAPEPARVREGDLVAAGTDGLTPPRMTRRATVPYPPMARAQRVEGTVMLNVLVSESGQVLDVRVIRGVAKSVGLNEAAEQIVRRSSFSAPTLNGVRVKAWTTVPIDFKL